MNNQLLQDEDFDAFAALFDEKAFNKLTSYEQNLLRNSVSYICKTEIKNKEIQQKLNDIYPIVQAEQYVPQQWELIKNVASGKITIDDVFYNLTTHSNNIPGAVKNQMMIFSYLEQRFGGISDKIEKKINEFILAPNIHNFNAWATIASASKKKNANENLPQWLMELDGKQFLNLDTDYANYFLQKGLTAIASFKKESSQEWFNKHYNDLVKSKKFAKWLSDNPEYIPTHKEMPTENKNFVILKHQTTHLFFPLIADKGYTNENFETLMLAFQKTLNKNNAISKFEHDIASGTATTEISYEVQIFRDNPESYFMDLDTFESKKKRLNSIAEEFKSLIELPQFDAAIKSNKPFTKFYDNDEHSHFLEIKRAQQHREELNVIIADSIKDNNDDSLNRTSFKL